MCHNDVLCCTNCKVILKNDNYYDYYCSCLLIVFLVMHQLGLPLVCQ